MLLARIEAAREAYRRWLETEPHHPFLYKWEVLAHFQTHWNPQAPDGGPMYDQCLQNTESRRLWVQENWFPKKMMLEFWKFDGKTVRWMFDDLFNETKDPEGRAQRFRFGCDALLADYRRAFPLSGENDHFHGDYRMISLYLALRYPESYAPYDQHIFRKTLMHLGARDVPDQHDLGRFFKVTRTLMGFLDKDPAIDGLLRAHLREKQHFSGRTFLLAEDFCRFIASNLA